MEKLFKIKYDDGQVLTSEDVKEALTLFCSKHKWEVTKLPLPIPFCYAPRKKRKI